jgi:hypothetical protein
MFETGNVANDRLLALNNVEQAYYLGKVTDQGCVGQRAFYMGMERASHKAFWSVHCVSGNEWAVEIDPDANGATTVLDCATLTAVARVNCFVKFNNQ